MELAKFIIGWFYYSFYYMLFSALATIVLNRVTKKLWLTPLIINGVSISLLLVLILNGWIGSKEATYAVYFNYLPIVFASIIVNVFIGIINNIKIKTQF